MGTGSVRVLSLQESQNARRRWADRIISSRMVRRWKPQEGTGAAPKAKSRGCVRGHQDPDTQHLSVYAPTPSCESLMAFLAVKTSLGHELQVGDLKNAFCQSDRLKRESGRLFVEPCEGVPVPKGTLIELVAPVYGLDDAPLRWHLTLTTWLKEQGFQRTRLEPCWWVRRFSPTDLDMVLVEVDDLIMSLAAQRSGAFRQAATTRFKFGKWKTGESEFAGRRLRQRPGKLLVDQEKYILEELKPMALARGRTSQKASPLSETERAAFRSMVYQIN